MKFRRISKGFCLFLGRSLVCCNFFLFRFLRKNATDSQNKNVHHNLFLLRNLNKPRLKVNLARSQGEVESLFLLWLFCKSDIKRWVTPELAVSDPIKDSKCQIEWRKSWFVQWPKHNNHISLVWKKNDQVVVWYFLMDATLWDVYC